MTHFLNQYFEQIYVISIKRNAERLESFVKFNPDLKFQVFEGIDGKELFPELDHVSKFPKDFFIKHDLSYERCKQWNKGQLGCAMSNLFLQRKIVEEKIGNVLILEDDAFVLNGQYEYLKRAVKELPANWDLLYLGFNPTSRWSENRFTRGILRVKHYLFPKVFDGMSSGSLSNRYFSKNYSKHLNIPGVYGGTHPYALSFEGARKIVKLDSPLKYGFDTTLMHANYNKLLNSYSLKKPVIVPNSKFETSLIN